MLYLVCIYEKLYYGVTNPEKVSDQTLKKVIAGLLALVMAVSLLTVPAFAANGSGEVPITVKHQIKDHDGSNSFVYSNNYFNRSGYEFRLDLAKASLGMNFAAGSSYEAQKENKPEKETQNWESFARQTGFQNAEGNEWMHKKARANSAGVSAAEKRYTDAKGPATLIAVGFRGAGYRSEWGGNFNLGETGEHQGFAIVRDEALKFVKSYIQKHNITGRIKVWVSGYSRAAAGANLFAGALDNGYDLGNGTTLSPDDLYAYTFETPLGATSDEVQSQKYDNIHNIINPNDLVTYIAFTDWGFARYGLDHYIPVKGSPNYDSYKSALLKTLKTVDNDPEDYLDQYWADAFQGYTVRNGIAIRNSETPKEFYKTLGKSATTYFVSSRKDYVDNLQDEIVTFLEGYKQQNKPDQSAAFAIFTKKIQDNSVKVLKSLTDGTFADLVTNYLVESFKEAGITDLNADNYRHLIQEIGKRLQNLYRNDPSTTVTFIRNIYIVFSSHLQETTYSWLQVLPESVFQSNTGHSYNLFDE